MKTLKWLLILLILPISPATRAAESVCVWEIDTVMVPYDCGMPGCCAIHLNPPTLHVDTIPHWILLPDMETNGKSLHIPHVDTVRVVDTVWCHDKMYIDTVWGAVDSIKASVYQDYTWPRHAVRIRTRGPVVYDIWQYWDHVDTVWVSVCGKERSGQ